MKTTDQFVFFWGKTDPYSNFFYSPFRHQGILFKWSEQAVMYRKAKLFHAHQVADRILKATSPAECKRLGRSHEINFIEEMWVQRREKIYKEVLKDKFAIPQLRKHLLETGSRTLAEASPKDTIWGIGLDEDHPDAENPDKWPGLNLLGNVLMDVRDFFVKGMGE